MIEPDGIVDQDRVLTVVHGLVWSGLVLVIVWAWSFVLRVCVRVGAVIKRLRW